MSKLINLIRDNASIEAIKADLYDNRDNEHYINIRDKYGRTALLWACRYNRIGAIKLLIEEDADVNLVDEDGVTALKIAKQHGHTEIIELLNNCNKPNNFLILNGKKYKLVEEIENEQTN